MGELLGLCINWPITISEAIRDVEQTTSDAYMRHSASMSKQMAKLISKDPIYNKSTLGLRKWFDAVRPLRKSMSSNIYNAIWRH